MAGRANFKISYTVELGSDCKSVVITDTTGTYSSQNPGGWGSPNPVISDVDTATMVIQNLTTDITYDTIEVTPSEDNQSVTLTTADLEVNGTSIGDITLPDGQYCFTYTVTLVDGSIYIVNLSKVFLCESCCKIKTKACELDLDCGCCNDDCANEINLFLQAYTEMKIVEYSAYCGSSANLNKKIKSLQSLLTTFDCRNC